MALRITIPGVSSRLSTTAVAADARVRAVEAHYEQFPYPTYPLWTSVPPADTYAWHAPSLWTGLHGTIPTRTVDVLVAGCGSFLPYPAGLANPEARVVGLDLSAANLRRARIHVFLHGLRNVDLVHGDLLDPAVCPGPFGLIDAYGVLHHLPDPLLGLRRLRARLAPGGLLRVMVYSRGARGRTESARRALKAAGIHHPRQLEALVRRAPDDSRLKTLIDDKLGDDRTEWIDALLHPLARTFTVDEFRTWIADAGLHVWRFAHRGCEIDVEAEWARLRKAEAEGRLSTQFVAYLTVDPPLPRLNPGPGTRVWTHPALRPLARKWTTQTVSARLGRINPVLDWEARRLLRTLSTPKDWESLDSADRARLPPLVDALFVLVTRRGSTERSTERSTDADTAR